MGHMIPAMECATTGQGMEWIHGGSPGPRVWLRPHRLAGYNSI
jgi:hypothetical protein